MALNYHAVDPIAFESVSAVTATPSVDLGTRRVYGGEEYVYVYNDTGTQISKGYGAVMSGHTGMSVIISSPTFFGACIGVVKHATLTSATYGWLLTRGFTDVKMHADSSGVAGQPIRLGLNGTFVDVANQATLTTAFSQATAPFGLMPIGVCVQATASAGTGYAYVKCFG